MLIIKYSSTVMQRESCVSGTSDLFLIKFMKKMLETTWNEPPGISSQSHQYFPILLRGYINKLWKLFIQYPVD